MKNISRVLDRNLWVVQREKRRRREVDEDDVPSEVEILPGYEPHSTAPGPTLNPDAAFLSEELAESSVEDISETEAFTESEPEFGGPDQTRPRSCTYVQSGRNGIQSSTSSCERKMPVICSTNITGQCTQIVDQ